MTPWATGWAPGDVLGLVGGGGAYIMENTVTSGWVSGCCNRLIVSIKLLVEVLRGLSQFISSVIVIVAINLYYGAVLVDISCIDHFAPCL